MAYEDAEIAEPGSTSVAAHTFFEIVRKLPEGAQLALSQASGSAELSLEAGRSTFALPCLAADEFPAMATEELEVRFAMPPSDLAKLIDKTRFAISTEETRYYLNGIHLHAAQERGGEHASCASRPTATGLLALRSACQTVPARSRRSSSLARP